jgi:hypothetical protein
MLPLLLTGCETLESARKITADSLGNGQVFAWYGYEGRFTGPVAPQTPGCGAPATGGMTVGEGKFALDPFAGTTVIAGTLDKDGTMQGIFTRFSGASGGSANPLGQPAEAPKAASRGGRQVLSIAFIGRASTDSQGGQQITGSLTSGPCRWSVALKRD